MNIATVFQGATGQVSVTSSTINAANTIHTHHYYNSARVDSGNAPDVSPTAFIKPDSSALFTGREDVLAKLKAHFERQSTGNNDNGRRYFLLYGMGGIGKTQICLKFIEQMDDSFPHVFWIDASSEETIILSLKGIAKSLGRDASSESAILQWIGSLKENWLLMFDNADLGPEVVEKFIPPGQRGNILISSRNGSLRRLTTGQNSLELQEMEEEDAISLLLKAAFLETPSVTDQQSAKAIVTELCCLPLAIDQAGSSIGSGLCDISGYLKLFSSKSKDLLDDLNFKGASKYGRTVYGTWELTFQEIQRRSDKGSKEAKSAIIILKTFAFCHHSNIKEEIFERAALNASNWNPEDEINIKLPQIRKKLDCTLLPTDKDGQWESLQFKHGIRLLLSFSLIKLGALNTEYSVHPLVHAWIGARLSASEQHIQSEMTIALLSSSVPDEFSQNGILFCQTLVPHIFKYYNASEKLESYFDDVYQNFGYAFYEAGHWRQAYKLWSKVFEIRSLILGKNHQVTTRAMQNLAITYKKLGNFAEAVKLEVDMLGISKMLRGEIHPDTVSIMNNLALTYQSLGNFTHACFLQVQVVEISKESLGLENPKTISRMYNLGNIYHDLGRYKDAEKLHVQVLEISKRLYGEEHPQTMKIMDDLALTYRSLGRLLEAEKLQVKALEISLKLFGEEHPDTMSVMGNLAQTYLSLRRFSEAEKLEVHILETSKEFHGEDHPDTLSGMQNLANTYLNMRKNAEAEILLVDVLERSKRVLGEDHPVTLDRANNLSIKRCMDLIDLLSITS